MVTIIIIITLKNSGGCRGRDVVADGQLHLKSREKRKVKRAVRPFIIRV